MNWLRNFASNVAANIVATLIFVLGSIIGVYVLAFVRTLMGALIISVFLNLCFVTWTAYRKFRKGGSPKRRGKARATATAYHPVDLTDYFNYFYRDPATPNGKIRLGPGVFDIVRGSYQERAPYHPRIILLAPNMKNGQNGLDIPVGVDDVTKSIFSSRRTMASAISPDWMVMGA